MKPSWLSSVPDFKGSMALLDSLYGLTSIQFAIRAPLVKKDTGITSDCMWINPKTILSEETIEENVEDVGDGWVRTPEKTYKGLVIVAAGVWTDRLVKMPPIKSLCGSSLRAEATVSPTILPYAPYKQAVWFNFGKNDAWFGDGTSILRKNFDQSLIDRTESRAMEFAKLESVKTTTGMRPYVDKHSGGYYSKLGDRLFVSTGGAKNGTALAAANCLQLIKDIKSVSPY
jgi:glycine/D-amino acid oxidase-like deaminating enzyme